LKYTIPHIKYLLWWYYYVRVYPTYRQAEIFLKSSEKTIKKWIEQVSDAMLKHLDEVSSNIIINSIVRFNFKIVIKTGQYLSLVAQLI
jgi:hypothetical protein